MKVEPSRLPTTNVLVQSFIFQTNTSLITQGGFGRFRFLELQKYI